MKVSEAKRLMCPFSASTPLGNQNSIVGKVCQTTTCMAWQKNETIEEGHMGKVTVPDDKNGFCLLIQK